jgi:hypothetical protein
MLREEIPMIDWMRLTSHEVQSEGVKESDSLSEEMIEMRTRNSRTAGNNQSAEMENHQSGSSKDEEESIRLEDLEGCCGDQVSEI